MSQTKRDNFTAKDKEMARAGNAAMVVKRWPEEFFGKPPHYMCEECRFVSDQWDHFQVDHIFPCAEGGTRNQLSKEVLEEIARGHVVPLYRTGINYAVLCFFCNQAKKARQFVPPGAGYAFRRREWDRNPDHIYQGGPTASRMEMEQHPEPYDPNRYK